MRSFVASIFFVNMLYGGVFNDYTEFAVSMHYETDYDKARKKALSQKKKLFVFFVKEGCPFCTKMEEEVLTDPFVRKYIKRYYVPLIVNRYDRRYPRFLDSRIAPVSYIVDPKTQTIEEKIIGYMEPEQYLWQFPSKKNR